MTTRKPLVLVSGGLTELTTGDTINSAALCNSVTQTAHGFSVANAIYYTGSVWAKAKADSTSTLGIAIVTSVTDANTFTLSISGYITGLSGLSAGQYYYVSAATAGLLTVTEPGLTLISNPLFFADSTSSGFVLPYRPSQVTTGFFTYNEVVYTPSISTNVLTLNLLGNNNQVFNVSHNANITTLTISNPPVSGYAGSFTLFLTQDATGGRTLTFPASCKFSGGISLPLTTTALKANELIFRTFDSGTTWLVSLAGKEY